MSGSPRGLWSYIELVSVLLISVVFAVLLWKHGLHFDPVQFALRGVRFSGVRLGLVLAMFSFVGFESATTLGEEAKHPLRTIPRAVIQSAMLSGLFFIAASYTEVLGFPASAGTLDQSAAPMSVLSTAAGIRRLGPVIDICAMVSMFACTLACVTAAARVLLLMAHNGLAPRGLSKTHPRNETPHIAVLATGAATMILPVGLRLAKVSGETIYDWMGSLATYGFITVYALVAIALPCIAALGKFDIRHGGAGDGGGRGDGGGVGGDALSGSGTAEKLAAILFLAVSRDGHHLQPPAGLARGKRFVDGGGQSSFRGRPIGR